MSCRYITKTFSEFVAFYNNHVTTQLRDNFYLFVNSFVVLDSYPLKFRLTYIEMFLATFMSIAVVLTVHIFLLVIFFNLRLQVEGDSVSWKFATNPQHFLICLARNEYLNWCLTCSKTSLLNHHMKLYGIWTCRHLSHVLCRERL